MADNKDTRSTPQKDDSSIKPPADEQEEVQNKAMSDLEDSKNNDAAAKDSEILPPIDLEDDNSNELTDEQEAALQRIMAEIEATSASKSEKSPPDGSITADQEETLNKIVTELQGDIPNDESKLSDKIKETSNNPDNMEKESESKTDSNETTSEDLTPEQEETLQKVIAEINNSSPPKADLKESVPEKSSQSAEKELEGSPETKENKSSDSGFEELDLSDFESELQKVVAEAKVQSNQNQKPHRRPIPDPIKQPIASQTDETLIKTRPEKKPAKESNVINNQPNEKKSETIAPSHVNQNPQKTTIDQPKDLKVEEIESPAVHAEIKPLEEIPTILPKSKNKQRFKKITILSTTAVLVIFAVVIIIRWLPYISGNHLKKDALAVIDETQSANSVEQNLDEGILLDASHPSEVEQTQNEALSKALSDIMTLRSSLLDKLREIDDLKIYYKQGISEIEEELIELIRTQKLTSLKDALADQKIELGLRMIQRRKGYIAKLDLPFIQVFRSSEELLYLERKGNIFNELMKNTSGISLDPYEKQVAKAIKRISEIKENLYIDQSSPIEASLESIWNDLSAKVRSNEGRKLPASASIKQNETIWKEICSGNYDRKWALTDLDENTARCLLNFNGKDLYLNRLKMLTPEVAQILSRWSGEWLGLNGLTSLSPEIARHLARWKGKRLSLNSLSELSPKATLYLSKWQGDQLELVGLKHIGQWENPKIELFVSDKLRSQIPK